MREEDEAELRIAVAEGVLSREEAERLRGELRSAGRGPLELLKEHGRLSDETFALLRRAARIARSTNPDETASAAPAPAAPVASPERSPDETATQDPARAGAAPRAVGQAEPAFPVPGWDRYIPVRFLGQGGMGRVFLAYDPRLRREVALKFVRDDDAELARRFVSEARAQARVNHERVCKVYEVGEVQARVFIAMQYVAGSPLGQLAPELSVEQKALLLRDAAEGVHEAHRAGLIHRDIKPSNLMVERTEDGRFKLYVMDFGLARDWREGVTVEGSVFGTPHYMSPEQARGEVA
ncbi:MAG TPA: serine/threonine-protein kinase, partial [Longimicrobium sp.]|nr:serine/threonine-protein kinase [Longimicrobium sp.]